MFAFKVSLMSLGINFLSNYFLVERLGHVGLAVTSSLTLSLNALILWFGLRKNGALFFKLNWYKKLVPLLVATFSSIIAIHVVQPFLDFSNLNLKLNSGLQILCTGIIITTLFGFVLMKVKGLQWIKVK